VSATIEWVDTQEALPGESPSLRWKVPQGVRMVSLPHCLLLERDDGRQRMHPWARVRWIDVVEYVAPAPEPGPSIGDGLAQFPADPTAEDIEAFTKKYGMPPAITPELTELRRKKRGKR
jgi:hypothetical protein